MSLTELFQTGLDAILGAATLGVSWLLWRVASRQADIYQRQADIMTGSLAVSADAAQAAAASAEASKEAVEHAKESAQTELRAYVGLHEAKLTKLTAGGHAKVLLQFKNSGRTPAHKVTAWTKYKYDAVPEGIARKSLKPTSRSSIGPDGVISRVVELERALTSADLRLIRAGGAAIYVYGEVTYEDVFGQPHTTPFNLIHGAECAAGELLVCETGNDAN
jgi:hypothetical protein